MFFPIKKEDCEEKKEGFYLTSVPKVYIVDLKNKDNLYLYYDNVKIIYISYSNETNILSNINNLTMIEPSTLILINEKKEFNYAIL